MPFYLLDTNILIDLAGPKLSHLFFDKALEDKTLRLGTSILCAAEFFTGANAKESKFLKDWIETGELELVYLDSLEDAVEAGAIRKKYLLSMPDALILASCLRARAHLLTHDDVLLKKAAKLLSASDPIP